MKHQDAPGTTFKKHMNIAQGLLSEDDFLLSEILFNPYTSRSADQHTGEAQRVADHRGTERQRGNEKFLEEVRKNIE